SAESWSTNRAGVNRRVLLVVADTDGVFKGTGRLVQRVVVSLSTQYSALSTTDARVAGGGNRRAGPATAGRRPHRPGRAPREAEAPGGRGPGRGTGGSGGGGRGPSAAGGRGS